jgi:mannosyltransferase
LRVCCAALPWLALLLAGGLRLYRLGAQELRGDEAFSYLFARIPLAEIAPALLREGDPHSPLHYYLLHGIMSFLGQGEFALRLPSALMGIALVALLWQLGRETLGRRPALWLAGLAAVTQGLVWLSQDVRNQPTLAALAAVAASLALLRAVRRGGWGWWLAYAGLCALCIYGFYHGAFALAAHAVYVLAQRDRRRLLLPWGGAVLLAGLLFAPWLLAMWPGLVAAGQLGDPARPALLGHWVETGAWLMAGAGMAPGLALCLTLGGWALAALGWVALWRRDRPLALLLGSWAAGALLGIWAVRLVRATFNAYYAAVAAPAFWMLLASGLDTLWRRARLGRIAALALLALIVGINGWQLGRYYRDAGAGSRSVGYRPTAAHIAAQARAGDLFLANFPDPCWGYYLRDVPIAYAMQPQGPGLSRDEIEAEVANLAFSYERIWFVPLRSPGWDRDGAVDHWLTYHALLQGRWQHNYHTLYAYIPLESTLAAMQPLEASWPGAALLRGYHLAVDGAPAGDAAQPLRLHTGAELALTLLWEAIEVAPQGYTVFIHLLGQDGRLLAQHDGAPVWGTRPTTTWQPGDLVLDRHTLTIPDLAAPETGALVVGLYTSDTIERALLPDGGDALQVLAVRLGE